VKKELLALTAQIFREFPDRKREQRSLERTIEAMCRGGGGPSSGGAGYQESEQERILHAKEQNRTYMLLERHILCVMAALLTISKTERELVEMAYWDGLRNREIAEKIHCDERTVKRLKNRVLLKLAEIVVTPDLVPLARREKVSYPGQAIS
jgi:RNA polymerase sigma factor (sigma-70 family)